MRFASIETSTEWCSVALWADGEIAALERRAATRHSELALPMLGRLLAAAGIGAGQLDAVAFGAGPGSFTGLRIGCGLAQGLALSRAVAVARLAGPRLQAGEGVDAALAAPIYVRDKVALTTDEQPR